MRAGWVKAALAGRIIRSRVIAAVTLLTVLPVPPAHYVFTAYVAQ